MKDKTQICDYIIDNQEYYLGGATPVNLRKELEQQVDYLLSKLNEDEDVIVPGYFNSLSLGNEKKIYKNTLVFFTNQGIVFGHEYKFSENKFKKFIAKLLGGNESILFERLNYCPDIMNGSFFVEYTKDKMISDDARAYRIRSCKSLRFKTPEGLFLIHYGKNYMYTQIYEQKIWLIAYESLKSKAIKENNNAMVKELDLLIEMGTKTLNNMKWEMEKIFIGLTCKLNQYREELSDEAAQCESYEDFKNKYPELYLSHEETKKRAPAIYQNIFN